MSTPDPERTQAEADADAARHRAILKVLTGLLLGMFVSMLASTVVSSSLPIILADLHGGVDRPRILALEDPTEQSSPLEHAIDECGQCSSTADPVQLERRTDACFWTIAGLGVDELGGEQRTRHVVMVELH